MRKLVSTLAAVGLGIGIASVPALAASAAKPQSGSAGKKLEKEVSGKFSGTSTLDASTPSCVGSFPLESHQAVNATYTTNKGTGLLSFNGCLAYAGSVLNFGPATFTLTAPDGATLQGSASGSETNAATVSVSIMLNPTSGTNEFANVTGVINLTATWQAPGTLTSPTSITGSLSAALT